MNLLLVAPVLHEAMTVPNSRAHLLTQADPTPLYHVPVALRLPPVAPPRSH